MIYVEMQLSGQMRAYQMSDHVLLKKTAMEAKAACLPIPETMSEAHDFLAANCFQIEIFDNIEHALNWAENNHGFRAGEIRAELSRFRFRLAASVTETAHFAA